MPPQTINLYSLAFERSVRFAAMQHGAAGFFLFLTGLEQLQDAHEAHPFFTWLALLSGAIVLIAAIVEMRNLRKHRHTGYGWVDLFSVPVLIIEGMHKVHLGKKYLPWVYFFLAIVMLVRGLIYYRLLHLRKITMDASGFFARTAPFRTLRMLWHEVEAVETQAASINIVTTNGAVYMLDLKGIRNREEAQRQFLNFYQQLKKLNAPAMPEHIH